MNYGHGFDDKDGSEVWQFIAETAQEEMSLEDLKEAIRNPHKKIKIIINEIVGGTMEARLIAVDVEPADLDDGEDD
jgi:hypothetical protein